MEEEMEGNSCEEGSEKFQLNLCTKGHCFLCLNVIEASIKARAKNDNEVNGGDSSRERESPSVHNLCKHLKINLGKIMTAMISSPEILKGMGLASIDKGDMRVSLCDYCEKVTGKFSELKMELLRIQIEMDHCLGAIGKGIEKGQGNAEVVKAYQQKMSKDIHSLLLSGFIAELKKEIASKCSSTKFAPEFPKVNLSRVAQQFSGNSTVNGPPQQESTVMAKTSSNTPKAKPASKRSLPPPPLLQLEDVSKREAIEETNGISHQQPLHKKKKTSKADFKKAVAVTPTIKENEDIVVLANFKKEKEDSPSCSSSLSGNSSVHGAPSIASVPPQPSPSEDIKIIAADLIENKSKFKIKCNICQMSFPNVANLYIHKKKDHTTNENSVAPPPPPTTPQTTTVTSKETIKSAEANDRKEKGKNELDASRSKRSSSKTSKDLSQSTSKNVKGKEDTTALEASKRNSAAKEKQVKDCNGKEKKIEMVTFSSSDEDEQGPQNDDDNNGFASDDQSIAPSKEYLKIKMGGRMGRFPKPKVMLKKLRLTDSSAQNQNNKDLPNKNDFIFDKKSKTYLCSFESCTRSFTRRENTLKHYLKVHGSVSQLEMSASTSPSEESVPLIPEQKSNQKRSNSIKKDEAQTQPEESEELQSDSPHKRKGMLKKDKKYQFDTTTGRWKCLATSCNLQYGSPGAVLNHFKAVHALGRGRPRKENRGRQLGSQSQRPQSPTPVPIKIKLKQLQNGEPTPVVVTAPPPIRGRQPAPSSSSSGKYYCQLCKMRFKSNHAYIVHNKMKHQKIRYKCDNCSKEFPFASYLSIHKCKVATTPSDSKEKDASQQSKEATQEVQSTSTTKAIFKCDNCDKEYPYKQNLARHRKSCRQRKTLKSDSKDSTKQTSLPSTKYYFDKATGKYKCFVPSCPLQFPHKLSVLNHYKSKHKNCTSESTSKQSNELKLKEPASINKANRRNSNSSKEGTLSKDKKHSDKKPKYFEFIGAEGQYKCSFETCQERFSSALLATTHYEAVHLMVTYKCDMCNTSYCYKWNLKAHKKICRMRKADNEMIQPQETPEVTNDESTKQKKTFEKNETEETTEAVDDAEEQVIFNGHGNHEIGTNEDSMQPDSDPLAPSPVPPEEVENKEKEVKAPTPQGPSPSTAATNGFELLPWKLKLNFALCRRD